MVTHDQEEALSVADRIVVMNHGVIEQIGTPEQVYREPASAFVADFVGRVNVIQGEVIAPRRLRIGTSEFEASGLGERPVGTAVQAYLRPEDIVPVSGRVADLDNVVQAHIEKIEFLGAYCLAQVQSAVLGDKRLTTVLSVHSLSEQRLQVGSVLPLRLLPDRIRVFAPARAA
jgi:iron(III) transport system ATP-binding protein